jgi:hypothetical protein
VEPSYEKELVTFDDLLHSDVVYGYHQALKLFQHAFEYPAFVKFQESKTLQEDCSDNRKCLQRMITKRDIATVSNPLLATYVSLQMGIVDVGKIICALDVTAASGCLTVAFKKGNPLVDRFNILMRRYLEAGLQERVWTELQHRASLKSRSRIGEAAGYMYIPFSVSHLKQAFVVFLVGTVLSLVVFIGELIVNCLCKRGEKRDSRVMRLRVLRVRRQRVLRVRRRRVLRVRRVRLLY